MTIEQQTNVLRRVSLWISNNQYSVTVAREQTSHDTTAKTIQQMINAMPADDRAALYTVVSNITSYIETQFPVGHPLAVADEARTLIGEQPFGVPDEFDARRI